MQKTGAKMLKLQHLIQNTKVRSLTLKLEHRFRNAESGTVKLDQDKSEH